MRHTVGIGVVIAMTTAMGVPATTARAQAISGFSGFTLNNGATSTGDTLTLTDNGFFESRSAFYSTRLAYAAGFTATFTYTPSGAKGADGSAFVLENNAAGAAALGNTGLGGGLGYGGMGTSAAIEFNIYPTYTVGTAYAENGVAGFYTPTGSVNLKSGDPIAVTLVYDSNAHLLTESLLDTVNSAFYTTSYSTNLSVVGGGGFAYIGLSGSTGAVNSTQIITNFAYNGTAFAAPEPDALALFLPAVTVAFGFASRRRCMAEC